MRPSAPVLLALLALGCITEGSELDVPDPTPSVPERIVWVYSLDDAGVAGFGGAVGGRNRNPVSDEPGWQDGRR